MSDAHAAGDRRRVRRPGPPGVGMALGLFWGAYAAAPTAAPLPELLILFALVSGIGALLGMLWQSRMARGIAAEQGASRWLAGWRVAGLSLGLAALTAVGVAQLRSLLPGSSGGARAFLAVVGASAVCWALFWLARRSLEVAVGAAGLTFAVATVLGAASLRGQLSARVAQIDRPSGIALSRGIDVASGIDQAKGIRRANGVGRPDGVGRTATSGLQRRANLVLIVLDTVRADHLSTYGYPRPTSPFLSRLAEQGVLYRRAISPAPWTLPAHGSLFTGLSPSQHGATAEHKRLDDSVVTLGESLQAAGYETLGLTSNSAASSAHNLHQGFEHFYEVFRPDPSIGARAIRRGFPAPLVLPLVNRIADETRDKGAREVNRLVSHWLGERSERGETRPFFVFVNLLEAHLPYDPPQAFRQRFDRGPAPASLEGLLGRHWFRALFGRIGRGETFTGEEQRALADRYDAEIAYQDERLAELIALLDARFAVEDLAIVVTSDHGENLGEHGLADHVFSVHQSLLHVPLLVRHPPRFPAGVRIDHVVSTASVYTTLLELAGLQAPAGVRRAVAPALPRRPGDEVPAYAVSEEHLRVQEVATLVAEAPGAHAAPWLTRFLAVQDGHRKLVQVGDREPMFFDLDLDPGELLPLPLAEREDARSLAAVLAARQLEAPSAAAQEGEGSVGQLDAATRESLEALGYLEDGPPGG